MNEKVYKNAIRVILGVEFIVFFMPPLLFAAIGGLGLGVFFLVLFVQALIILFTAGPSEFFMILFRLFDSNWSLDSLGGKISLVLAADFGLIALLRLTVVAFVGGGIKSVPIWTWPGILVGWWIALDFGRPFEWDKGFYGDLSHKLMGGFGTIFLLLTCLLVLLVNSSLYADEGK